MSVIKLNDLRKTYKTGLFGRTQVEAVRGVDLEVAKGEIFGILGPNGAGKTTIIKILMGLISATSGSAEILGHALGDVGIRAKVGYLPEHHRFPDHLTGRQALDYYGRLAGMSSKEVRARESMVLEKVGMVKWATTKLRNYSKGMGQRLGLAQAMIHDPDLYFLDEPTDGVDPVGRAEIRAVLEELGDQGKTVFINSHLLQEVELVCQRVAILTMGQVLKVGTMKEITTQKPQVKLVVDKSLVDIRADIEKLVGDELGQEQIHDEGDGKEIEVTVPFEGPKVVDDLVDLIRAKGYSLRALIPVRLTLEEAFLEAVGGRQVGGTQNDGNEVQPKRAVLKATVKKAKN